MRLLEFLKPAAVGLALSTLATLPSFADGKGNPASDQSTGGPGGQHEQIAKTELIDYTPNPAQPVLSRAMLEQLAKRSNYSSIH